MPLQTSPAQLGVTKWGSLPPHLLLGSFPLLTLEI